MVRRALVNFSTLFLFRFNEMGKRVNYSFDVLEMTSDSRMIKVGTWGDRQRLKLSNMDKDSTQTFNPPRLDR